MRRGNKSLFKRVRYSKLPADPKNYICQLIFKNHSDLGQIFMETERLISPSEYSNWHGERTPLNLDFLLPRCLSCHNPLRDDLKMGSCGHVYHATCIEDRVVGCLMCPSVKPWKAIKLYYDPISVITAMLDQGNCEDLSDVQQSEIQCILDSQSSQRSKLVAFVKDRETRLEEAQKKISDEAQKAEKIQKRLLSIEKEVTMERKKLYKHDECMANLLERITCLETELSSHNGNFFTKPSVQKALKLTTEYHAKGTKQMSESRLIYLKRALVSHSLERKQREQQMSLELRTAQEDAREQHMLLSAVQSQLEEGKKSLLAAQRSRDLARTRFQSQVPGSIQHIWPVKSSEASIRDPLLLHATSACSSVPPLTSVAPLTPSFRLLCFYSIRFHSCL